MRVPVPHGGGSGSLPSSPSHCHPVTLSPRHTITPSPVPAAIRGCRRGKSHEWENGSSGSAAASPARLTSDVPRGSASLRPPAMWVQILHPTTATTRPAPLRGSPGHRTAGGGAVCLWGCSSGKLQRWEQPCPRQHTPHGQIFLAWGGCRRFSFIAGPALPHVPLLCRGEGAGTAAAVQAVEPCSPRVRQQQRPALAQHPAVCTSPTAALRSHPLCPRCSSARLGMPVCACSESCCQPEPCRVTARGSTKYPGDNAVTHVPPQPLALGADTRWRAASREPGGMWAHTVCSTRS